MASSILTNREEAVLTLASKELDGHMLDAKPVELTNQGAEETMLRFTLDEIYSIDVPRIEIASDVPEMAAALVVAELRHLVRSYDRRLP